MWKLTKDEVIALLLVTLVTSFPYCYGVKINLTESCTATQARSCVLFDISTSFEDPFFVENATQSVLGELIIRDTVIVRFPREILQQAPNLHTLIMHNCGLNRISTYDFEHATELRTLILQRNRLSEITEKLFTVIPSLRELHLGQNNIHMVHQSAFAGLTQLSQLDLQQNAIHQLSARVFWPLVNLEYVDLSGNEISKIDSSTFAANAKLKTLLLNNNKFSVFEPNSLEHLPHLNLLDISNSFVEELNIQSVDTVYAQNSGLKRCNIRGSIIKFHASNNALTELNVTDKAAVRELELHGNLFATLDDFVEMVNLQHLDLSKNHISTIGSNRSSLLLPLPGLSYLNLAFNKLKNLTMDNFLMASKLTHLDLAFNNLAEINADVFDPLEKLEKLYIDGNGLHVFDYKQFLEAHTFIKELGLNANSWNQLHVREMLSYLEKHSVQLSHHYPTSVREILSKTSNLAALQQRVEPAAVTAATAHFMSTDVCQCSSLNGDILVLVTFVLVFLIFLLQVFRFLREKNCASFCWRRRSFRFGQQWQTEPLDESVSEV